MQDLKWLRSSIVVVLLAAVIPAAVAEQTWTLNYKEADLQEVIRFVAEATDKTIIVEPRVKGKVQVISARPVNKQELYDLFLSILEVQGYTAVEAGNVVRIIPDKDARAAPVPVYSEKNPARPNSEIITQVIQLKNISAAKLIPVLRPLAPQQAHMAAYAPSNAIIISDTAANIERIRNIISEIDLSAIEATDVIKLNHASAEEVVRMLTQLQKSEAVKGAETKQLLLVADKRTNSVLINGDELDRQRIQLLISYLDTPLAQSGNVQVVYLEYANAVDLAAVLQKVVQNIESMAPEDPAKANKKASATIEADEGTNALIITASADVMQSLLAVVERLDIRRAQVLVEAIIVEITATSGEELGFEWLFVDDDGGFGSINPSPLTGPVAGAAFNDDADANPQAGLAQALVGAGRQALGIGRLDDNLSFSAIVSALRTNDDANILSTPSLLTLDNQEATIVVGQNIPFVTGAYTATGDSSSNPGNPFQTIQRENVGITLTVKPSINEGSSLVLELTQEVSDVEETRTTLNQNLITKERKIQTKVLADDGQTIVLGGLIQDNVSENVSKVPLLGDIPWIGRLFRSTSKNQNKTHLMVFLKPTIIRDDKTLLGATAEKYRGVRSMQQSKAEQMIRFTGSSNLPILPEWEEQIRQLESLRQQQRESAAAEAAQSSAADNGVQ